MSRRKLATIGLAILVVNFAIVNIVLSSRCSLLTEGNHKVPQDFATRRKNQPLSEEAVLSYLQERKMIATAKQMEKEIKQRKDGRTTQQQTVPLKPAPPKGEKDAVQAAISPPRLEQGIGHEIGAPSNQRLPDADIPVTSSIAWSNVTTMGFYEARLFAGFRNQIMCFTIVILEALRQGHGQVLMETIPEKDTYGSNKFIPFHRLWDIPYWNSHYPQLPRLVEYDPVLHDQFNPETRRWYRHENGDWTDHGNVTVYESPTRPTPFGQQHKLLSAYMRYAKGNGPYASGGHRNAAETLMLRGAMRPHPKLRAIINRLLNSLVRQEGREAKEKDHPIEYMALHARVEPDMQRQMVCVPKKVLNLTDIFGWIQEKWPEPPVHHIFMPINREYLEQEGSEETIRKLTKKKKPINWIAVENLRALNRARDSGLWGGRAKVFEFGSKALNDTEYSDRPSTTGSLVNFFIGVGAKIFIGTEVSSYSHDLLATRFYRDHMENYKYLPDGLHHWTPPGLSDPPGFSC